MRLAYPFTLALLCSGGSAALAQSGPHARPAPGPTRDAGTYHVASGTWTRSGASSPALSPDAIYRNDVPIGYFGGDWEGRGSSPTCTSATATRRSASRPRSARRWR